jgi:hypothetical protein
LDENACWPKVSKAPTEGNPYNRKKNKIRRRKNKKTQQKKTETERGRVVCDRRARGIVIISPPTPRKQQHKQFMHMKRDAALYTPTPVTHI